MRHENPNRRITHFITPAEDEHPTRYLYGSVGLRGKVKCFDPKPINLPWGHVSVPGPCQVHTQVWKKDLAAWGVLEDITVPPNVVMGIFSVHQTLGWLGGEQWELAEDEWRSANANLSY